MRRLLAILALTGLCSDAFTAGTLVNAIVIDIRMDQDGRGMVIFNNSLSGGPGCVQASYANPLAFDSNAAGGKAILALVIATKASGSPISVYGTGACNIYPSVLEDWNYGVNGL